MSDLENRIIELCNSDTSHFSVDDLVKEIRPVTVGLKVQAPQFEPGMLLFRARSIETADLISELSYPPPIKTKIGRANREGKPMFYASSARSTVFFEASVESGSHLLVSRWKTTAPLLVNHIAYHSEVFARLGSTREIAGWDGKIDPHAGCPESRAAWGTLAKLFAEKDNPGKYKLSVAAAECMLGGPFKGLLYPSIAMWANGDNLAILPDWVDVNLQFIGVEKVLVKSRHEKIIEVEVVDYATSSDGKHLEWKGRGPTWKLQEQGHEMSFTSENGIWVARNKSGAEIDPE